MPFLFVAYTMQEFISSGYIYIPIMPLQVTKISVKTDKEWEFRQMVIDNEKWIERFRLGEWFTRYKYWE
jgi:hypothetical protein